MLSTCLTEEFYEQVFNCESSQYIIVLLLLLSNGGVVREHGKGLTRCWLCNSQWGHDGNIARLGIYYLHIMTIVSYRYHRLQTVMSMTYLLDSLNK